MEAGPWNYLEVAKLVTGLFVPAALAIFGIYVHRITKRFEHVQWQSQKLIEKRLAIYDELAPILNDVLCYFTYVGAWREFAPPKIVSMKRQIDKRIYHAAPLFSEEFFHACMEFQGLCFETYTGWGRDALLRTNFRRRQECRPHDWNEEWCANFSKEASDPAAIRDAYNRIMNVFAKDIGVYAGYVVPPTGGAPANIR